MRRPSVSVPLAERPVVRVAEAERLARVTLSCGVEPGDGTTSSLVRELGAVRALEQSLAASDTRPGSSSPSGSPRSTPSASSTRPTRCGIRFLVPGDPEWPGAPRPTLDDGRSPTSGFGGTPPGLWVKGPMPLTELADVGRRGRLTRRLGLRRGDDPGDLRAPGAAPVCRWCPAARSASTSWRTTPPCAAGGATVAVLACGVDRVYPAAAPAAARSTSPRSSPWCPSSRPGSAPTRLRFLARNRLIAALTRGTVLVEAALRSGALNTVGWAESLNRQVMCVPGPGHQLHLAGRQQPAPRGPRHGGHPRRRGARAGRRGRASTSSRSRAARPVRATRSPAVERQVIEWVPVSEPREVDSISRLCGLHVRDHRGRAAPDAGQGVRPARPTRAGGSRLTV